MGILGIDVSAAQGPNLKWRQIAEAGIRFAILKATQGSGYEDPTFRVNYDNATAAGVVVGAYHWLTTSDAKKQAEWTLKTLGDRELPAHICVDFEDRAFTKVGKAAALESCETYVEEVERQTGKPVTVYTGKWFWVEAVGTDSELLADRALWHAEYPSTKRNGATMADYVAAVAALPPGGPHVASPWESRGRGATIWQFDGNNGLILPQGIDSDFNLFMGSEAEFKAYVTNGEIPTPEPRFIPTIANIQQVLIDEGLDIGSKNGKPDGISGPKTIAAIKEFQRRHQLKPDGIVGTLTIAALAAEWATRQQVPANA